LVGPPTQITRHLRIAGIRGEHVMGIIHARNAGREAGGGETDGWTRHRRSGLYGARGRLVPVATQPVGDETDFLFAAHLLGPERRHAVVALAEETLVGRIGDERRQPLAGTKAGQIRTGGVITRIMKPVTL